MIDVNKDSKRVRIRNCPGVLKVPCDTSNQPGLDTIFKCQLEANHQGAHIQKGTVYLKNSTGYEYSINWLNIGPSVSRQRH